MIVHAHFERWLSTAAVVSATVVMGTLGYCVIERWPILDSFYMTVITMSTVGYGETQELSLIGRCFTTALIVMCIGSMTFLTATITSFIVENDLQGNFLRSRTMKTISSLKGHTIICGASPMAEAVIDRLMKKRRDVVVIDESSERLQELRARWRRLLIVEGKATNELTLANANVLTAANVVAALPSEMDNLLVAITCKDMGQHVKVVAESNDHTIANRMRKAHVDAVVQAGQIVGNFVADTILDADAAPHATAQPAE